MTEDKENGIKVITFGCRLNTYESEVMKSRAKDAGIENAVIINTCAVTGEAERQARQAIRKARKDNPDARIIVTGCAAQVHSAAFADMPEVDQVIGNDLKLTSKPWAPHKGERVQVNDIMSVKETASHMISGFEERSRAFVQVQNGCDHRCTFLIIPYGRGNSRSVNMGEILGQVKKLVEGGYQEIVLTGVDITSYGADLAGAPKLGQMAKRLLELVPEIKRLRLSSLDPSEIDDDIWHLIANEPRFMPHLHLSMQAGDDMILKRMKRRHLQKDIINVCNKARALRPDMVFGADIIAGFPTETDEMFLNTLNLAKDLDIAFMHVFPYSARVGTPAAKMPQIKGDIRKERARLLREAGEENLKAHMQSLVGKTLPVLAEKDNCGRTEYFSEVKLDKDVPCGHIVMVQIKSVEGDKLLGTVI